MAGTVIFLAGPALAELVTFNFAGTIFNSGLPVTGSITYDTSLGYIQPPPSGMSVVIGSDTIQSAGNASLQVLNNSYGVDNFNVYFTPISINGVIQPIYSYAMNFSLTDMSQTVFSITALPHSLCVNSFDSLGGAIFAGWGNTVNFSIDTLEGPCEIPVLPVKIDIKPGSCPNPITLRDTGVMPVAIMGTADPDFDVSQIDPASIRLSREGVDAEVAPLRWSYYDAGIPFEGELCACVGARRDRITDLALKFSVPAIIDALQLAEVVDMTIPLTITGNLKTEFGGTPITGRDCLLILKK
jgi:hypothetical protein